MSGGERRPDPDALLARVEAAEARLDRGRLKVYFGAAAGVGKTYAMLDAAQRLREGGVDVVVGWVEPHGRPETLALLEGLEALPPRVVAYRGTTLRELDLDAALARRPAVILVDELAHTNAPGSRHPQRWDDVPELLDAGIDVHTTLNVQHLESSNDIVAQVTGIGVRETVPDAVLDRADEVELVDLSPDDLLVRLRQGKVYVPDQAREAARNFFRKGNLLALRELALRRVAERVDAQMEDYRVEHAIAEPWPAGERLLVCVGPGPLSVRLVRNARRMAAGLRASWHVLNVETPQQRALPPAERERIVQTLRLAEQLGAETATIGGVRVAEEVLSYARRHNATKIVVGKPVHPRWRDVLLGSLLDEVVRGSGAIDVYVISGDPESAGPIVPAASRDRRLGRLGASVAVVAACTAVAWAIMPWLGHTNVVMVYMLGIAFAASRYGRGAAILASVLSVASFDFFFVLPYFTFAVADANYLFTFAVMLAVALLISTLALRLRQNAESAREGEHRAAALYALSRDLASTRGLDPLLAAAVRHTRGVFGAEAVALLPDDAGRLAIRGGGAELDANELAVAQWALEHGRPAGAGTGTLPGARGAYIPLRAPRAVVGVLGVRWPTRPEALAPATLHFLETFANQTALAVERAHLAEEAERTRVQIETERLRSALLGAISHDLRTPLASIAGAASALSEGGAELDAATRDTLLHGIYDEADQLNLRIGNLLEMTRLESGALELDRQWQSLEEVIGAALARQGARLGGRAVGLDVPPDLPLIPFDAPLVERVLVNLIENAVAYGPPGGPIDIEVRAGEDEVVVGVADRGPGIGRDEALRVFEPFVRGREARASGSGVGLGLAICRGIVAAHGGRVWAEERPGGGAVIRFALPLGGNAPDVALEPHPARDG